MRRHAVALAAILAALAAPSAQAQVTAQQAVLQERVVLGPDGTERLERSAAGAMTPGDRVAYVLAFENGGAEAAGDLVLVMPVPASLGLIADSAAASDGTQADYSVDGGTAYGALADLTVREEGAERPARPSDVTHLRWRLTSPLAPGARGEVSYSAVLR